MKTFNGKFLTEAKDQGATFTFGRFNPPTTGHEKLVKNFCLLVSGTDILFSSHSKRQTKKSTITETK